MTSKVFFPRLEPAARRLLDCLAMLAPDPIPRSLIGKGGEDPDLWKALMELSRHSLVRFPDEPPESFVIPRLTREIVREHLGVTARRAWEGAVEMLVREAPGNVCEISTWNAWRRLAPHCEAVLAQAEAQDGFSLVLHLMNRYATFLKFANADYAGAEPLYRRALEGRKRVLGPEHPDTLTSLNNLAALLDEKGDYAGAERLHRQALEARERLLGPEHPSTLLSLNNLAALLDEKGDCAGAEPLYRRALEGRERVLGRDHPSTLTSLNNLAVLLKAKGDYTGAEPLYRRTLEGRERVLGRDHPNTLISLNNLAMLLKAKGDYTGAEPLYRRALEARERVLGPEHPDTLRSRGNLAALLKSKDTSGE